MKSDASGKPSLHRLPASLPVLVAVVTLAILVAAPELAAGWFVKEGPAEQVSHGLLALGGLAWLAHAFERGRGFGPGLYLLLILGEETNWGPLEGDLHNLGGGHSYLLFAVPIAAFLGWGWFRPESMRGRYGAAAPSRLDIAGMVLGVGIPVLGSLFVTRAYESILDETSEFALYVGLIALGCRGLVEGATRRE